MEGLEKNTHPINGRAECGTRMSLPEPGRLNTTFFVRELLHLFKHVFIKASGNSQGEAE